MQCESGEKVKKAKRKRTKGSGTLRLRGGIWQARWQVHGKVYVRTTGTGNRRDPKAKAAWEKRMARNAERSVKADARMFAREHGKQLDALRRDCPGFAEGENAERTATALKVAMLEARDRSGLTQAEIAGRMGVEPSNLSSLLHGSGGVNSATFAAFLRACGFGFTVALVPFPKARARTLGRR